MAAGRYPEARQALDEAERLAAAASSGPLESELALVRGRVLEAHGEYKEARAAFENALSLATQWEQWDALAVATRSLTRLVGERQNELGEARSFARLAFSMAGATPEGRARRETLLATTNLDLDLDDAQPAQNAEPQFRRALLAWEHVQSPDSREVARLRQGLANELTKQGRLGEAEVEFRLSLSLLERTLPATHPALGRARHDLAQALARQDRYAEAEVESRRALELMERAWGTGDAYVSSVREQLARILSAQGRLGAAEAELRRALEELQQSRGPDNLPRATGAVRHNLAKVLTDQERYAEAEAELRATLEFQISELGPQHADVVLTKTSLAKVLMQQGKLVEASAWAERVLAASSHDNDVVRADATFLLAKISWRKGSTASARARTRELVVQALESYSRAGDGYAPDADRVRAWRERVGLHEPEAR